MSQSPSVTPTAPLINNALGSLELDLEAELRRYRRHRSTEQGGSIGTMTMKSWPEALAEEAELETPRVETTTVEAADGSTYETVSLLTPENPATRSPEVEKVLELLQQPDRDQGPEELLNLENRDVLPQDYLESSEELLKTLEQDVPIAVTSTRKSRKWTPLEIGFVAASIFGVSLLLFAVIFRNVLSPAAKTDGATVVTVDADLGSEPTTVNLAKEEFVNLSLDNLSVVDPDEPAIATPPATTVVTPAPAAPANPDPVPQLAPLSTTTPTPTGQNNLASAILPPSLRPQPVNPFPVTPQVAANGAAAGSSGLMVTPDGLKVGYYYVIFRNTSPRSLGKAREFVADAFVRTFPAGRAIQMAEVNSQAQAQALVTKFKSEQIAAEIYHHQLSPAN
ncbi:MAG: hypothetical protein WBB82_05385 [Limnothrix sp.]